MWEYTVIEFKNLKIYDDISRDDKMNNKRREEYV